MLKTAFDLAGIVLPGVGLTGVGIFGYYTFKRGVPWAVSTVKAWWSKGKADLANLKGDVVAIEQRLRKVEQTIGIAVKNVAPAPAPTPAAVAPAAAPAPQA